MSNRPKSQSCQPAQSSVSLPSAACEEMKSFLYNDLWDWPICHGFIVNIPPTTTGGWGKKCRQQEGQEASIFEIRFTRHSLHLKKKESKANIDRRPRTWFPLSVTLCLVFFETIYLIFQSKQKGMKIQPCSLPLIEWLRVSSYFQAEAPTEIDCCAFYKTQAYMSLFCGVLVLDFPLQDGKWDRWCSGVASACWVALTGFSHPSNYGMWWGDADTFM